MNNSEKIIEDGKITACICECPDKYGTRFIAGIEEGNVHVDIPEELSSESMEAINKFLKTVFNGE